MTGCFTCRVAKPRNLCTCNTPPQVQKEKREVLMGSIEEAQQHYAELSESIQRTNNRIMNATEELQQVQGTAALLAHVSISQRA